MGRAGAAFERQAAGVLVGLGWYVTRSAGSHGPADLVAVAPSLHLSLVLFVQAKLGGPGRVSPAEWNTLLATARRFGGLAIIAHRPARGRIEFLRVHGEKPEHGAENGAEGKDEQREGEARGDRLVELGRDQGRNGKPGYLKRSRQRWRQPVARGER